MKENYIMYETPVLEYFQCEAEGILCLSPGLENWGEEENLIF